LNPANNSVIAQRLGSVNVTIECALHNQENQQQLLTVWYVLDLGGVEGPRDILRVPSAVIGGTPSNGTTPFDTYGDEVTFSEFTMDMHGATVFCGIYPTSYGIFHLRVFSKLIYCLYRN
jgi:hypothetical protein